MSVDSTVQGLAKYVCGSCGKNIYHLDPKLCFYRRCKARMCSEQCRREHHNEVHLGGQKNGVDG